MIYMQDHTAGQAGLSMVTLGERGQIVIPAAIREQLNLEPGAKLAVFTKMDRIVCLVPASSLRSWIDDMTRRLSDAEQIIQTKDPE